MYVLLRQQQLSEVDDLYRKGQYEILASTLTECFKYCAQQVDIENPELESLPDRPTQMAMLLDSLWQLQKYSVSQSLLNTEIFHFIVKSF